MTDAETKKRQAVLERIKSLGTSITAEAEKALHRADADETYNTPLGVLWDTVADEVESNPLWQKTIKRGDLAIARRSLLAVAGAALAAAAWIGGDAGGAETEAQQSQNELF